MMRWIKLKKEVLFDKAKQKIIVGMQSHLQKAGFDYSNNIFCFGKNMLDVILQFIYFLLSVLLIIFGEGALVSFGLNSICFASNFVKHNIAASRMNEKLEENNNLTDNIRGVTYYGNWNKFEILVFVVLAAVTFFSIIDNPGADCMDLVRIKFFASIFLFVCFWGNIENNVLDIFSAEIKVQKLDVKSH